MITSTIGDLLDGNLDLVDIEGHHVYMVRDGEVVFYVGKSKDPVERLLGHCGRGGWVFGGKSALGYLIEANSPEARQWQVELLTITDCEPYVKWRWWSGQRHLWTEEERRFKEKNVIADCEVALIDRYRPCLNSIDNPHPTPLPEKVEAREREYFDYPVVIMPWDEKERSDHER